MKVGDLVRFSGIPEFGIAVVMRHVSMYHDTVEILWSRNAARHGDRLAVVSMKMLEVISENR